MKSVGCVLTEIVLAWEPAISARRTPTPAPFGIWIRDDTEPTLVYRRIYTLKPDGTYELVLTSRQKGSANQTVVARETGQFIHI